MAGTIPSEIVEKMYFKLGLRLEMAEQELGQVRQNNDELKKQVEDLKKRLATYEPAPDHQFPDPEDTK